MADLLLVIRAGRESIHRSYSHICSRSVDILVSTHDGSDWRGTDAKFVHAAPGGKFQGLSDLFASNPQLLDAYRHFWLFEDDLYLPLASLDAMLRLLARHDPVLAAPALAAEGFNNWPITVQNERMLLRATDFVEIMAPVMSREFLKLCLPDFAMNYSGYGQEWLWRAALRKANRFALILDAAPIVHARQTGKGSLAAKAPDGFAGFRAERDAALALSGQRLDEPFRNLFGIARADPRRILFGQDLVDAMLPGYETLMRRDQRRAMVCLQHLLADNRPVMARAEAEALGGFASLRTEGE